MNLISFGGVQLARPGAYSVVNVKNNTPSQVGSLKVLAAIGSGTKGKPGVPLYFNDPSIAAQQVGGTDVLEISKVAWENGADLICMVLTDTATPATYDVKSTDVAPATLFTLQGERFNTDDNKLQISVAAPVNGAQTLTITDSSVTPYVTETYSLKSSAAGIATLINQINTQSALVTAIAGVSSTTNVAATLAGTSMAGGIRTAGTPTTISNAIGVLQTEDIQGIITSLVDSTTQNAIFAHCNTMSSVDNRRERRAFLGAAVGSQVADYQTAIGQFTSSGRATVVAPGGYRAVGGVKTLVSSAFTAAAVAGLWAGRTNPNDPVTFKFISGFLGLETNFLNADIKTLVQSQVSVIEAVPNRGYRVVRALTGDQSGTNLVELSVSDLVDVMTRSVREQLEDTFVGKAGYNGIVNDITQRTQTILESFKTQNWIVDGTDAFGQDLPAYRNISVSQQGTQFSVSFEIAPSLPINFITITANVNV